MRVVLSGGGTGGHVYPALAIAEQLRKEYPEAQFLYIGTSSGLESGIVSRSGLDIPFEAIPISGFKRRLTFDNVKTVMRFFGGIRRSKALMTAFRPDFAIGTGGYVCGPVLYAAAKMGVPTLVHEQNVIPGLTNKFLSRYVDTIAVSFSGSEQQFPAAKRAVFTGNPRATTVSQANPEDGWRSLGLPSGRQLVVVVGGSGGARAINEAMIGMAPLVGRLSDTSFLYVTGQRYYEETSRRIRELALPDDGQLMVMPYVDNMPEVLAASSLVVNRSGASTMAELTALGIPAIFIPSPNVTNNHQEKNARLLEKEDAARVLLESELTGERLFEEIEAIMTNSFRREEMASASRRLGTPDSAQRLVDELLRLRHKR
ncbi:UDP-N-acetylglucosamine--N-acetylmuramyl-(pentapeptide) pyrophosphoryl-undecaprenol N-acetylglucosamine transferase 1 [Paenibacillus sp. J31TS4]|uniref:undecaprenyldiphospho-muramoylpentapeptide beta-N-acetylglucosaminyltransferase n=1 Tax=Paenibacillus sp. J31TS4 TaxID=2807195 RepID=UPI001B16AC12|nr:undecaprenyldiphospho-muramoylpentapeptide beta-N-acetylglucosaminyltransferase [Paenibacillus sp. J31TS4]GIP39679.1 UDP-N-acetylglucosamine--N-acetylmuramyl-(pentapeptide) pyrophosphoryl-undecaprenol N-acetylglucosamine transferase 1 [Paenibacillus sp. J31TS4]